MILIGESHKHVQVTSNPKIKIILEDFLVIILNSKSHYYYFLTVLYNILLNQHHLKAVYRLP